MGIYTNPGVECWEPTMHLAYIRSTYKTRASDPDVVLHQQWRSTLGRTQWLPVPEIHPEHQVAAFTFGQPTETPA